MATLEFGNCTADPVDQSGCGKIPKCCRKYRTRQVVRTRQTHDVHFSLPVTSMFYCNNWSFTLTNCSQLFILVFILLCSISSVQANTTEATNTTTNSSISETTNSTGTLTISDPNDTVPKAVITVAALLAFFIISYSVAKLLEFCYDRRAIRDDASDISDYTKEILKAQMMMLYFNRGRQKGKKLKPEDAARKYAKVWRAKLARNKARRMKTEKEATKTVEAIAAQKTQKKGGKASLSTVNEVDKLPLGATAKKSIASGPKQSVPGSSKKGSSRPISAGLNSRPVSAKSTTRPKSGFKSFGRFMVRKN